jgi:hypothetical protein
LARSDEKSLPKVCFELEIAGDLELSGLPLDCVAQCVPSITGLHGCAIAGAQSVIAKIVTKAIRVTTRPIN